MARFRKQPREGGRRSIRRPWHDYTSAGFYFITICTKDRLNYLAAVTPAGVRPTRLGRIVMDCWSELPSHFPGIAIDTFVVMPDHLHGIIVRTISCGRREPGAAAVLPGSLGAMVRSFKSAAMRRIRLELPSHPPIWQRNYHERILRDQEAVFRVRRYIRNNPAKLVEKTIRRARWTWRAGDDGARRRE